MAMERALEAIALLASKNNLACSDEQKHYLCSSTKSQETMRELHISRTPLQPNNSRTSERCFKQKVGLVVMVRLAPPSPR